MYSITDKEAKMKGVSVQAVICLRADYCRFVYFEGCFAEAIMSTVPVRNKRIKAAFTLFLSIVCTCLFRKQKARIPFCA